MYCQKCGSQNDDQAAFCDKCGTALEKPSLTNSAPVPTYLAGIEYAGFWRRLAACLIDIALVVITYLILAFAMGVVYGAISAPEDGEVSDAVANLIAYVAWGVAAVMGWLYYALMESSSKQATLGKMALGIKVTDAQGRRVSFTRATGRHFSKILSGIILYVGYIMIAFTAKKQGLHDIIAECLVVKK